MVNKSTRGALLLLGLAGLFSAEVRGVAEDLVGVIVVHRHGDRTPIDPYPTDPYKNRSYWPVGFGQLTNLGKDRMYNLGKYIRERYDGFLPQKYSEDDIHIRSTDVDRTLMSAYSNLAGLYPPVPSQRFDAELDWQPIPVHTTPEKRDHLLAMKEPCPRYTSLVEELMRTPYFIELHKRNRELYEYVSKNTGRKVTSIEKLEFIYNTLLIEEKFNFSLPEWTKKVYPDKMQPTAFLSFAVATYTHDLARLKTGPLMNEFIEFFKNKTTGATTKKMRVYSAHDTTIASILNTLKIFEHHSPAFASMILFELRKVSANYYIDIYYKNSTVPRKMKLPACDLDCPLEKFVEILEPVTISSDEWFKECQAPFLPIKLLSLESLVIMGSTICFLGLLVSLAVGCMCSKPKIVRKQNYLRLPDSDEAV